MTKIGNHVARATEAPGLERPETALERGQSRQLGLGHVVIVVRQDEIDVSFSHPAGASPGISPFSTRADRLHGAANLPAR
jgi:hypothetical protein